MRITPEVEIKKLNECNPGDLVVCNFNRTCLGIVVSKSEEKRKANIYLMLSEKSKLSANNYIPLGLDNIVICYGSDYTIKVDPLKAKIGMDNKPTPHGSIANYNNNWILSIESPNQNLKSSSFWNLFSGEEVTVRNANEIIIFKEWEIYVSDDFEAQSLSLLYNSVT